MSKPIRITDYSRSLAKTEFESFIDTIRMPDGEVNYSRVFKYDNCNAVLWLTQLSYGKTLSLLAAFSVEVAWHGLVSRKSKNEFVLEDIFVYPQEVTGGTSNTDQELYTKWLYEFPDHDFNKIRMQGHSHVNMAVSPSVVDARHRERILNQLDEDMFYVFMIWNKSLDSYTLIYDMANNTLYENKDVAIKVIGDDPFVTFLKDAKGKVQKKNALLTVKHKKSKRKASTVKTSGSIWDYPQNDGRIDYFDL